jgi:hypothetical protein
VGRVCADMDGTGVCCASLLGGLLLTQSIGGTRARVASASLCRIRGFLPFFLSFQPFSSFVFLVEVTFLNGVACKQVPVRARPVTSLQTRRKGSRANHATSRGRGNEFDSVWAQLSYSYRPTHIKKKTKENPFRRSWG